MSGKKLLPCPFCGNIVIEIKKIEMYGNLIKIFCICGAEMITNGRQKAIYRWNKRTPIVQQQLSGSAIATRKSCEDYSKHPCVICGKEGSCDCICPDNT